MKDKCGFEVWPLLMDMYEKKEDGRHLGMFQTVLDLELPEKMGDVVKAILDWENATKVYEDQSGLELPQQILRGVLVKQLPDIVKTQVRLNASQLPTYMGVRKYVRTTLRRRKYGGSRCRKRTEMQWMSIPSGGARRAERTKESRKAKAKARAKEQEKAKVSGTEAIVLCRVGASEQRRMESTMKTEKEKDQAKDGAPKSWSENRYYGDDRW